MHGGTGLMDDITFVGLDVHKATVCIAIAQGIRGGEVRQLGVFENRREVLSKAVSRLSKAVGGSASATKLALAATDFTGC